MATSNLLSLTGKSAESRIGEGPQRVFRALASEDHPEGDQFSSQGTVQFECNVERSYLRWSACFFGCQDDWEILQGPAKWRHQVALSQTQELSWPSTRKEPRHHQQSHRLLALLHQPARHPDHTARTQGFLERQPWRLLQVFGNLRAPCLPNDGYLSIQALSNRSPELAGFPSMDSFSIQVHIAASISASVTPFSSRCSNQLSNFRRDAA